QRRDDRPAQELARASYDEIESGAPAVDEAERDHEGEADAGRDGETGGERERVAGEEDGDGRGKRRRRRRRRGGRRDDDRPHGDGEDRPQAAGNGHDAAPAGDVQTMEPDGEAFGDQ